MMSNFTRKYQVKYSKLTNEENMEQVGSLEDVVIVPSSGSTQGLSKSLNLPTFGPCYLCPTVGNHREKVNKIVETAIEKLPNIGLQNIKSLPFCHIKVPTVSGEETLCLDDIEQKYVKDFPEWDKDLQCFPEGPIFYDKLFKTEPFTRAIDIEERFKQLKNKIQGISEVPFDVESDSDNVIISKTVNSIWESLQNVITYLNLENNLRVKKNLPNFLSGMVKGKLTQLKEASESIDSMHEVQNLIFEKVLENDSQKGYYQMR